MSNFLKLKKTLTPFFIGFILIILVFVFFPKKDIDIIPFNFKELSQNNYSQSFFADPTKKTRPEWPEFLLISDSYLQATLPPVIVTPQVLGALIEGYEPEDVQKIIVEYIVEPGDNLWLISQKFNINLDTILWANNLNKNSVLQSGQKLIIPPVSGVIHQVKAGDTVSEIAKKYKAKIEEIISFNDLSSEADIFIGDILVIPNGVMPAPSVNYASIWVPIADSYFICPIALPCRITQGLHWYNGIDFSHGHCGEPIFAAAQGKVLKVKLTSSTSRWAFGGAGNNLTILHPNGVVTSYGHIATSFVNPDDEVSQGQIIALMGGMPGTAGAGMSTGCHLHFGVSGAKNPFAR
jgi:LysM repeat protein